MAKKEFTTEISNELMNIYLLLGIDKPTNHEDIIQFVSEDVEASTNTEAYTSEDIKIAFRRLIETYEY
jgi:hypothetical protein